MNGAAAVHCKGKDKSKTQIHKWVKVSINSSSSIDANKKSWNLGFDYTLLLLFNERGYNRKSCVWF